MNNEITHGESEVQETAETQTTEKVLANVEPLHDGSSTGTPNEPPTPVAEPAPTKPTAVTQLTAKFSNEEMEYLQPVIDYHIKQGWATSKMDFLRKAVDFSVNLGHFIGKQFFGVPDGHKYKLLSKGFKDFQNKKVETCK